MTIECYVSACPFHSCHDEGPDEGPFCYQDKCQVSQGYIDTVLPYCPGTLSDTEIDALEREHFGDPDKKTGIYHPDVEARRKRAFILTYEWQIGEGTLSSKYSCVATSPQDAFQQFMKLYNGTRPLVSLVIKPAYSPITGDPINR